MNQTAQQWLTLRKAEYQRLNTELITHACQFVDLVDAQKLPQGLQMADELLVLNCDNPTLMAAIVYPSIYHQQLPLDLIEKFLPNEVYKLAQGVQEDGCHSTKS